MKTIGKFLKHARLKNKHTREDLAKETKIKKDFIEAIENESWERLPEYPVILGFVKKIAQSLGVKQEQAIAILRRDYPPKTLPVNPNPDIDSKFIWSPKLTFISGVVVVVLVVLGYLGFQYFKFVSPPELKVSQPVEGIIVEERSLLVTGKTEVDATIRVNNQPVLVDDNGNFETEIEINESTSEIQIEAVSRSGKVTIVKRTINPGFE
jgi:transcriptional regulator with XRE-family HTH domain